MKTSSTAWTLGIVCCLLLFVGAYALFRPKVYQQPQDQKTRGCLSNLKQLDLAAIMYSQDYDDGLPPLADWKRNLFTYVKNDAIFLCPSEKEQRSPSYAFNAALGGQNSKRVQSPDTAVLLFESRPGPNQTGGQSLLPNPPRHEGGHIIGFLDNRVKWVPSSDAPLDWQPSISKP